MTLIKWNNKPVSSIFDRAFDNFFDNDFGLVGRNVGHNIPAVNIQENEKEYHLELAVPGLKKEDIKVQFDNGLLSIFAEQKNEEEAKESNYTRREFSYQSFQRSFRLPEIVNEDAIDAKCEDGVLKVLIPKKEEAQPKRREINIG